MIIGWDQILKLLCSDGVIKACKTGWQQIGYMIHYKENIQKLEDKIAKLEDKRSRMDEMAKGAIRNGHIVEAEFWSWLRSANGMSVEVEAFLADRVKENQPCFKWHCPNICCRYRLGRESIKKMSLVSNLVEEGTKLVPQAVAHTAPPPEFGFTFSENYKDFKSRETTFKEIMQALEDPRVKVIGVYGPGGVGKTTMAVEVGKQAKRKGLFDDVTMAVLTRNVDMKRVQGQIAGKLGLKLELEEDGRAGEIWKRLDNGKKNLVILDDVWGRINLAEIGIPITDGKKGCKVLITSRKRDLCQVIENSDEQMAFPIRVLQKEEAQSLFKNEAALHVNSKMPPIAEKICDKCGGLPVAVVAVAKALRGKDGNAWEDALELMKNSKVNEIVDIDSDLFSSLRLSYDLLQPKDAQSCFLLCTLFPEDVEISLEDLVIYIISRRLLGQDYNTLEKVRKRVSTLVQFLKASSLLLDGRDKNMVKMHDVIRDVAISIAEDEKGYMVKHNLEMWPERGTYERHKTISLRSEHFQELPNELECKQLCTLVLRSSDSSLPHSFFNGVENNLEVLDLREMDIESLPSSIAKLVMLRMLFLPRSVSDVSLLGRLKKH